VALALALAHCALPAALPVPGGQAWHFALPGAEKVSAGQGSHCALPGAGAWLPAAHSLQAALPGAGA
jgi:hypothetical protein